MQLYLLLVVLKHYVAINSTSDMLGLVIHYYFSKKPAALCHKVINLSVGKEHGLWNLFHNKKFEFWGFLQ